MNKILHISIVSVSVFALALLHGCSESEFASTAKRTKTDQSSSSSDDAFGDLGNENVGIDGNLIHVPSYIGDAINDLDRDNDGKIDEPVAIGKAGKGLDISLDPSKRTVGGAATSLIPIDVYFAIDNTGSMSSNINTIKDNVEDFAKELEDRKYNARLGLIPFKDSVGSIKKPTSDIGNFRSSVSSLDASGGGDSNEAALAAVSKAVEMIKESGEGRFSAIVAITDNPAHMGMSTTNCDISALVNQLNALDERAQYKTKIYGSFADGGARCSGFSSAKSQFKEILDKAPNMVPKEQRGNHNLSYPFRKGTLIDELIPSIEKTIPSKQLICIAQSAKLSDGATVVSEYKVPSLLDAYKRYTADAKVFWPDAIKDGELEKYSGQTLELEVTRCCLEQDKAAAGAFEGCIENIQKAKFEIM